VSVRPGELTASALELLIGRPMDESPELRLLFHRLNNQLGVILSHAELLEIKARDDMSRARASQVVSGVLEALTIIKDLRSLTARLSLAEEAPAAKIDPR